MSSDERMVFPSGHVGKRVFPCELVLAGSKTVFRDPEDLFAYLAARLGEIHDIFDANSTGLFRAHLQYKRELKHGSTIRLREQLVQALGCMPHHLLEFQACERLIEDKLDKRFFVKSSMGLLHGVG